MGCGLRFCKKYHKKSPPGCEFLSGGGFCFSLGRAAAYRPFSLAGHQPTGQITLFLRLITTAAKGGQGGVNLFAEKLKSRATSFPFRPDVPFARDVRSAAIEEQTPALKAPSKILFGAFRVRPHHRTGVGAVDSKNLIEFDRRANGTIGTVNFACLWHGFCFFRLSSCRGWE